MCVLAVAVNLGFGALPPGYEDVLFCPPLYCLQPKDFDHMMTGPRSMFYECVHEEDDSEEARVGALCGELSHEQRIHKK